MDLLFFLIFFFLLMGAMNRMPLGEGRLRHQLPRRRRRPGRLRSKETQADQEEGTSRASKKARSRTQKKSQIQSIHIGDIIEIPHIGQDFIVEEHYHVKEKSWEWDEYTLVDGEESYTLSVAERGEDIQLSHKIDDLELSYPPPESVEYNGESFKLIDSGQAHSTRSDEKKGHRFKYFTYESNQESSLILEDYEGDIEYFLGEKLHVRDLEILPNKRT